MIPGYGYHLLRTARDMGADFSSVKLVLVGAEKSPPGMRKKMIRMLEELGASDVEVKGLYGFTEGRLIWGECSTFGNEGYHLYPDMAVMEIVDPKTGERVGDGEEGEIVFTPLDGRGSIVLRYGTGDIAKDGIVWDKCPHCGMAVPRLSSDIRRMSQIGEFQLTKIKGTLIDMNQLQHIINDMEDVEEWQLEIRKKNDDPYELDELHLYVAARKGIKDLEDFREEIKKRIYVETEIAPNEIYFISLQKMLDRIGMEKNLKETRIVDKRPKVENGKEK